METGVAGAGDRGGLNRHTPADPGHAQQGSPTYLRTGRRREHGPTLCAEPRKHFSRSRRKLCPCEAACSCTPLFPPHLKRQGRIPSEQVQRIALSFAQPAELATTVLPARSGGAGTIRSTMVIFPHLQRRALAVAGFHACACCAASNSALGSSTLCAQ